MIRELDRGFNTKFWVGQMYPISPTSASASPSPSQHWGPKPATLTSQVAVSRTFLAASRLCTIWERDHRWWVSRCHSRNRWGLSNTKINMSLQSKKTDPKTQMNLGHHSIPLPSHLLMRYYRVLLGHVTWVSGRKERRAQVSIFWRLYLFTC